MDSMNLEAGGVCHAWPTQEEQGSGIITGSDLEGPGSPATPSAPSGLLGAPGAGSSGNETCDGLGRRGLGSGKFPGTPAAGSSGGSDDPRPALGSRWCEGDTPRRRVRATRQLVSNSSSRLPLDRVPEEPEEGAGAAVSEPTTSVGPGASGWGASSALARSSNAVQDVPKGQPQCAGPALQPAAAVSCAPTDQRADALTQQRAGVARSFYLEFVDRVGQQQDDVTSFFHTSTNRLNAGAFVNTGIEEFLQPGICEDIASETITTVPIPWYKRCPCSPSTYTKSVWSLDINKFITQFLAFCDKKCRRPADNGEDYSGVGLLTRKGIFEVRPEIKDIIRTVAGDGSMIDKIEAWFLLARKRGPQPGASNSPS